MPPDRKRPASLGLKSIAKPWCHELTAREAVLVFVGLGMDGLRCRGHLKMKATGSQKAASPITLVQGLPVSIQVPPPLLRRQVLLRAPSMCTLPVSAHVATMWPACGIARTSQGCKSRGLNEARPVHTARMRGCLRPRVISTFSCFKPTQGQPHARPHSPHHRSPPPLRPLKRAEAYTQMNVKPD